MLFFPNILNTDLYSDVDRQTDRHDFAYELWNIQKQIQKSTGNGLQNPNNIPQHFVYEFLIILHVVSLSVGLCLSLYVMLRSARHRTSQKKKNYLYYMEDTMGSI
jgi:hypothetical protein